MSELYERLFDAMTEAGWKERAEAAEQSVKDWKVSDHALRNEVYARYKIGPDVDLRGADLSYADLHGADLSYADLSDADLSKADLSNAYLNGTDLSNADLRGTNLSGTYLPPLETVCGGVDKRGYRFVGVKDDDKGVLIFAGCRRFTIEEAKKHWSAYIECLAKVALIQVVAKSRGWLK